jgi:hypothetical protein
MDKEVAAACACCFGQFSILLMQPNRSVSNQWESHSWSLFRVVNKSSKSNWLHQPTRLSLFENCPPWPKSAGELNAKTPKLKSKEEERDGMNGDVIEWIKVPLLSPALFAVSKPIFSPRIKQRDNDQEC